MRILVVLKAFLDKNKIEEKLIQLQSFTHIFREENVSAIPNIS